MEKDLRAHHEAKRLQPHIESLNAIIRNIESGAGAVELRGLD